MEQTEDALDKFSSSEAQEEDRRHQNHNYQEQKYIFTEMWIMRRAALFRNRTKRD
jgi:hypothetical protein